MKVLVLGAGVAGVSCAWYLAEAGHEVTVIDRAEGVAMETSFANAGQLSYGYTTPWAAPGIPTKALKWLFKSHPPLLFRPDGSLYQVEWLWQMLRSAREIDWDDMTEAAPAFLTIVFMPFTYSIADGIAFGFISYAVIKLLCNRIKDVPPMVWIVAVLWALKFWFMGG